MVGGEPPHGLLRVHLNEVVELVLPDVLWRDPEGLGKSRRRGRGLLALRREVELDPVAPAVGGQEAALRLEARLTAGLEVSLLPEDVSGGERGVAAQGELDGRREPAEGEAVVRRVEERGRREVHFARDRLHPRRVPRRGEDAHRGRIAPEWRVGERVDLDDREPHGRRV